MPPTSDFGTDAEGRRLQINSSRDGGSVTIALDGDLDFASVDELETAILAAEQSDADAIRLDLAEVTFIDSTGLSQLLEAKKRSDGRFRVTPSNSEAVSRLLSLTGTTEILE
jgi:anti-anti-sigma factor